VLTHKKAWKGMEREETDEETVHVQGYLTDDWLLAGVYVKFGLRTLVGAKIRKGAVGDGEQCQLFWTSWHSVGL
jgi:hypothetical protein